MQDAASSFATALATAKRRAAATAGARCVDRAVLLCLAVVVGALHTPGLRRGAALAGPRAAPAGRSAAEREFAHLIWSPRSSTEAGATGPQAEGPHSLSHTHAHTHTHTYTHTHTPAHTHTHTHTHAHTHRACLCTFTSQTSTHRAGGAVDARTPAPAARAGDAQTPRAAPARRAAPLHDFAHLVWSPRSVTEAGPWLSHRQSRTLSHAQPRTRSPARTLSHTLAHSRTHPHTPAHPRTLSLTLASSRTHSLAHSRTLSLAHSRTHTLAHSRTLSHTVAHYRALYTHSHTHRACPRTFKSRTSTYCAGAAAARTGLGGAAAAGAAAASHRITPRRAHWTASGSPHPRAGTGAKPARKAALKAVVAALSRGCDRSWFDARRTDACPNNGKCFPGVICPRLAMDGAENLAPPAMAAVEAHHGTPSHQRGQRLLNLVR